MSEALWIIDLHVSVEGKEILRGVDLTIRRGEVHALMGPNGSGKSTLGYAIMGHPGYEVTQGRIDLSGENLLELAPHERARRGVFLAFQRPMAIPGVRMADFLRHAATNVRSPYAFVRAKFEPGELLDPWAVRFFADSGREIPYFVWDAVTWEVARQGRTDWGHRFAPIHHAPGNSPEVLEARDRKLRWAQEKAYP